MRRDLVGAARVLAVPTIAFLAIVFLVPGRLSLGLRIYALVLCAALVVLLLLALRRAYPDETRLDETASRARRTTTPRSLTRLENEVALGVASAFDLHIRLAPHVRAIAVGLLLSRRRVSLDERLATAREILGEDGWGLVRPDRQPPDDRLATGTTPRELERLVEALETA